MKLTLYVLFTTGLETTFVYALDEKHALERKKAWLAERPHLSVKEVQAYPDGFVPGQARRLPGSIEVDDAGGLV